MEGAKRDEVTEERGERKRETTKDDQSNEESTSTSYRGDLAWEEERDREEEGTTTVEGEGAWRCGGSRIRRRTGEGEDSVF